MDTLSNLSLLDALALSVLGGMCLALVVMKVITWFIDRDIVELEKGFDAELEGARFPTLYPTLMAGSPAIMFKALPGAHVVHVEGDMVSLSTMHMGMAHGNMIDRTSI